MSSSDAAFACTLTEPAGRSGTVQVWSDTEKRSALDQFHGLTWSLCGNGVLAHKPFTSVDTEAYGVVALWPVASEAVEKFAELGEMNAVSSVEFETGCQAFGVFRSISDPTVFALVELFNDAESFEEHMTTDHFRQFIEFARPHYLGDRAQTLKGIATVK